MLLGLARVGGHLVLEALGGDDVDHADNLTERGRTDGRSGVPGSALTEENPTPLPVRIRQLRRDNWQRSRLNQVAN